MTVRQRLLILVLSILVPAILACGFSTYFAYRIVVGIPRSDVILSIRQMIALFSAISLLLLGGGGAMAIVIGRRIARPITALVEPAMALGRGEWPVVGRSGLVEVDQVADALLAAKQLQQGITTSFQDAITAAPLPIMLHSEDGRVVAISQAWTDITGYRPEDLRTVGDWTSRAYGKRHALTSARIRRFYDLARAVDQGEYRIRTADGTERVWAIRSAPVGRDENGLRLVVSMATDITDRIRTGKAMEAARMAAEQASQAKSRFLAAASHDLRQPLQSLFLYTQLLDQIGRLPEERQTSLIASIRAGLESLKRLLDGILDLSKLDAGLMRAVPTEVSLAELLDKLAGEYGSRAAAKGLRLKMVGCSRWVRSDPVLLERVLRNLIENALRYTETGGIVVGCRHRAGAVRLQVVDSGAGIPGDQQEAIFQEFFQLGNAEGDREKGLGLGLSIVRRICSILGHEVGLASAVGRGSCFWVELPTVAAQRPLPEAAAGPPAGKGLVVIVDDDRLVRDAFFAVLTGFGYDCLAAASAAEAVGLLEACGRRPDFVVADYRLQGGATGAQAIAAIGLHCGGPVPGILVTGDTEPERLAEAKIRGLRLLIKPVSGEALARVIAEVAEAA